jgi:hypothetical protein
MAWLHRGIRASRGSAALLAVTVLGAISTGQVTAGCIHDGLSRGWRSEGLFHFHHLALARALALPLTTLPRESPDWPVRDPSRPCSGPTCSENPGAPSSPAGVTPAFEPSQWATLELVDRPEPPSFRRLADACLPARLTYLAAGIFHPPRMALA